MGGNAVKAGLNCMWMKQEHGWCSSEPGLQHWTLQHLLQLCKGWFNGQQHFGGKLFKVQNVCLQARINLTVNSFNFVLMLNQRLLARVMLKALLMHEGECAADSHPSSWPDDMQQRHCWLGTASSKMLPLSHAQSYWMWKDTWRTQFLLSTNWIL